jgi:hypothetical protein
MVVIDRWSFRWKRVAVAVLAGEMIPIVTLIAVVAVYGAFIRAPGGESPEAFAERAGAWVGPVIGATCAFLLSQWAGHEAARAVAQGALIGLSLAVVDVALLVASGAPFRPLFLYSNLGKIIAGTLGGLSAHRSEHRAVV